VARPRQVTDEAILTAARACFLAHGPSVSTTVIAKKVGLSQAALFKRFGTKDDLMIASLAPPAEPAWMKTVSSLPQEGDLRTQLITLGAELGGFLGRFVPCFAVIRAAGIDPKRLLEQFEMPPPVLGKNRIAAFLGAAMDAGRIRACDPDAVATAFMGAFQFRAFMAHLQGLPPSNAADPAYAAEVVDALLLGLKPR
jgi:AcrR family transcriptional regulator